MKEVDLAGVKELIKNSKKTCNLTDPYPIQDISQAKNFDKIVQIFCNIINCSFKCNKFPDSEKQAVIHPFYKGEGDKNSFKYCRPISNLSFLSKIIEKAALAQLQKLLTINKVIPENQSAYRANHSTESCMIAVTNDLLLNMDLVLVWPVGPCTGCGPPPGSRTKRSAYRTCAQCTGVITESRALRLSGPQECPRLHII